MKALLEYDLEQLSTNCSRENNNNQGGNGFKKRNISIISRCLV